MLFHFFLHLFGLLVSVVGLHIYFACGIQAKWREMASLDRHVLLKRLRDVLESLRGRAAGRNKDDADEAISMVGTSSAESYLSYSQLSITVHMNTYYRLVNYGF